MKGVVDTEATEMEENATGNLLRQQVDHLLAQIQPNEPSELRRLTIGSYVCDLIKRCFAPQRKVSGQGKESKRGTVGIRCLALGEACV